MADAGVDLSDALTEVRDEPGLYAVPDTLAVYLLDRAGRWWVTADRTTPASGWYATTLDTVPPEARLIWFYLRSIPDA